jgi:hypothetical protein
MQAFGGGFRWWQGFHYPMVFFINTENYEYEQAFQLTKKHY